MKNLFKIIPGLFYIKKCMRKHLCLLCFQCLMKNFFFTRDNKVIPLALNNLVFQVKTLKTAEICLKVLR